MQLESDPKIQSYWLQIPVDLLILSVVWSKSLCIDSAFSCWFVDFIKCSLSRTQKFRVNGCRSLLICWFYIRLLQSVWALIAHFAVDLLIFGMAENWKVFVTGCKTLLICWFVELLSCWVVELLSCWAVDLLSHLLVIFLMVVLDPKIQSYRSQNTVDLLI